MGGTAQESAIVALSRWARDLTFDAIPSAVIKTSQGLILDTLGVAVAATADPIGTFARTWSAEHGSAGPASVIGSSRRLAPADAAFANATMGHALDYDDHGFGGHASVCVLPAVLGAGEASAADGRAILTAYVAGMEAFGRLATCVPVPTIAEYGFHPTGVLGLVASTIGVSKVLNLSPEQTAHALAIACSFGTGHTASFGTTVKPIHAGHAAASGVRGSQLARSGFTGNLRLFEDPEGFGHAYTRGAADWEQFAQSLSGPFRLEKSQPSIKQWPCCGGNMRSVQNLYWIMRDHGLSAADITKVEIHLNPRQLTALRYSWPTNAYEAKFCLPFTVATTLAKGQPSLRAFRDAYWNDPDVLAARDRIKIIQDGRGEKHQVTITVFTSDGRQLSKSEWVVHGSAGDPMTQQEISDKYFDACSFSKIPPDAVRALHDSVLALDAGGEEFWTAFRGIAVNAE